VNRRTLLKTAGWLTLRYPLRRLYALESNPRFSADPFAAGVASGDPTSSNVVLWTRLIPDANSLQDWQRAGVPVQWEIASDENMRHVVRRGREIAAPELGHSVHAEARGLDSNRWYWYRFFSGPTASPVGRTRTAPSHPADRIRFAFASCQQYQAGYFTPYANLVKEDIDVVVFLGDYIYETVSGNGPRPIKAAVPTTLQGYRDRYALYKSDPNLREAHRLFPWIITLDDHEVQNDYAAAVPPDNQSREDFLARRAAAYQAHQSTRRPPDPNTGVVYRGTEVVERRPLRTSPQSHHNPDRHIEHSPRRGISWCWPSSVVGCPLDRYFPGGVPPRR